jgi:hypothetical protein
MVFDHAPDHPSQWATIRSVAEKIGCLYIESQKWNQDDEGFTVTAPTEP